MVMGLNITLAHEWKLKPQLGHTPECSWASQLQTTRMMLLLGLSWHANHPGSGVRGRTLHHTSCRASRERNNVQVGHSCGQCAGSSEIIDITMPTIIVKRIIQQWASCGPHNSVDNHPVIVTFKVVFLLKELKVYTIWGTPIMNWYALLLVGRLISIEKGRTETLLPYKQETVTRFLIGLNWWHFSLLIFQQEMHLHNN